MKQLSKMRNRILSVGAVVILAAASFAFSTPPMVVEAVTIAELQKQISEQKIKVSELQGKIEELQEAQLILQEQMDDLNSEILNTMTSISMKEEAIREKIQEIGTKEKEIKDKEGQIEQTQKEYDQAVEKEEYQYNCMVIRIRLMYEKGDVTYLENVLQQSGLGETLNRMDYMESIYKYDKNKLEELGIIRQQVHDLWGRLELEKTELETARGILVTTKESLEKDKNLLQEQKKDLDAALEQMKKQADGYDANIKKWQQEANVAKKLLQQEQRDLKNLQDQENKRNQAMNQEIATTDYTTIINSANGSDLGKKIAQFACQYIGNPYVYGGTSLTNGTDCSGFTYRVYQNFGYSLPRTSGEQRSSGTGVEYADAQPGDLICYSGHVGIYIGDGKIVHASSSTTGIIVSKATYRTILAVRRII